MFGSTVMFNNISDAIIWRDINEGRQYANTYYLDNEKTIVSYARWHESYVQTAKILKYEALDKSLDKFIADYNSNKNYSEFTYYPISSEAMRSYEGPFEASKLNNVYFSIYLNQQLSANERSALVEKLIKNTSYGYLEYLTEVFKTASYETLCLCVKKLAIVAQGKYATERQLPSKNDNLYLSVFANPNLTEIQRANLITLFHSQYDHFYLFDRSIMGQIKDKKNFRLVLIESYIASYSKTIIDQKNSTSDRKITIPLVSILDPSDEKEIWNFIFEEGRRVLSTLKIMLKEDYRTDSKKTHQRFCVAYIDSLKSFSDIKKAVNSLNEEITSAKVNNQYVRLSDQDEKSLREEIKKAANKKILALRGTQVLDAKDEEVREYLGKDINDAPPTCCFFWPGSTKDQNAFDKLKGIEVDHKQAEFKK